jgi:hypothetical protein
MTHAQTIGGTTGGGLTGGGLTTGGGGGVARGGGAGNLGGGGANFGPTGGLGLGGTGAGLGGGPGGLGGGLGLFSGGGRGATGIGGIAYPAISNPYRLTYANPLGIGMVGTTNAVAPRAAFGQPLFGPTAATNIGVIDAATATVTNGVGFNTLGMRKAPQYVTTLADDFPLVQHAPGQLERDVRELLLRSSSLKSRGSIIVSVDGPVVILRGTALSSRDRRLAEALVRLTPGVRDVVNEIEVGP